MLTILHVHIIVSILMQLTPCKECVRPLMDNDTKKLENIIINLKEGDYDTHKDQNDCIDVKNPNREKGKFTNVARNILSSTTMDIKPLKNTSSTISESSSSISSSAIYSSSTSSSATSTQSTSTDASTTTSETTTNRRDNIPTTNSTKNTKHPKPNQNTQVDRFETIFSFSANVREE